MRLKLSSSTRTIRRYVERHEGYKHNCGRVGCSRKKGEEAGCGKWDQPTVKEQIQKAREVEETAKKMKAEEDAKKNQQEVKAVA